MCRSEPAYCLWVRAQNFRSAFNPKHNHFARPLAFLMPKSLDRKKRSLRCSKSQKDWPLLHGVRGNNGFPSTMNKVANDAGFLKLVVCCVWQHTSASLVRVPVLPPHIDVFERRGQRARKQAIFVNFWLRSATEMLRQLRFDAPRILNKTEAAR